jgi:hypothetical protein
MRIQLALPHGRASDTLPFDIDNHFQFEAYCDSAVTGVGNFFADPARL